MEKLTGQSKETQGSFTPENLAVIFFLPSIVHYTVIISHLFCIRELDCHPGQIESLPIVYRTAPQKSIGYRQK